MAGHRFASVNCYCTRNIQECRQCCLSECHIWYWWINLEHHKLSKKILDSIEQTDMVAISAVSCLEITWLVKKPNLVRPCALSDWFDYAIDKSGLVSLPVTREIATL